MMDQLQESLQSIQFDHLLEKLIDKGFPFACWQMPESNVQTLIIGLSDAKQVDNLGSSDSGFLANRFADNHPIAPFHIKSDIVVKSNNEFTVDPRVSDNQLSAFLNSLNEQPSHKIDQVNQEKKSDSFYESIVTKAIESIKSSELEKVVLSRFMNIELPKEATIDVLFKTICNAYPNGFCNIFYLPSEGVWMGASPELLLSDNNERFKTTAIAGTTNLSDDMPLSEIAWTQKEIEEQAFVSRYIINCFKKLRLREFHEHGPKSFKAGNLAHLKTEFEVKYNEVSFEGLADQMLELLHPTSAVCGMPLDGAQKFINNEEGYDRSFYSGFLGPVNFESSTDLFVNLRCMKINEGSAMIYAGAGITEDSNPSKELLETELKMNTLKSLITK